MKVMVVGKNIQISDKLDTDIRERADRLQRYCDRIVKCQVTVTKEPVTHRTDVVTHIPGRTLKATDTHESKTVSVGHAMDKMERQLRKTRRKQYETRAPRSGNVMEAVLEDDM